MATSPSRSATGCEAGLDLRRCEVRDDETETWSGIRLATRRRMAFDLLLDRSLPDAVADLDASLRAALVGQREMQLYLVGRRDRGDRRGPPCARTGRPAS